MACRSLCRCLDACVFIKLGKKIHDNDDDDDNDNNIINTTTTNNKINDKER